MKYLSFDSITTFSSVYYLLVEKIEMFIRQMIYYPRARIASLTQKYVEVEIRLPTRLMKLRVKIPRGPRKDIHLLCRGKDITRRAIPYLSNDCSEIIKSVISEQTLFGSALTRVNLDETLLYSPMVKYKRRNAPPDREDLLQKRRINKVRDKSRPTSTLDGAQPHTLDGAQQPTSTPDNCKVRRRIPFI